MSLTETGNPIPDQSKSFLNLLSLDILSGLLLISSHLEAAITAHLKILDLRFLDLLWLSCEPASLVMEDS